MKKIIKASKYACETCRDTGKVEVRLGPDEYEMVACPDCDLGLKAIEQDLDDNDFE